MMNKNGCRIEYYWNDEEIQYEIDLFDCKNEIKKRYFEPTKMWAEIFIENLKMKIKEETGREISSYFIEEEENENY